MPSRRKATTMQPSSIEVPNSPDIPGETKPRIAATKPGGQLTGNAEGINNMHDNFLHGMKLAGQDSHCLGYRPKGADGNPGPYQWLTFGEVKDRATAIGSGLTKLGAGAKSRIGIFAPNSVHWSLVEHASYIYNQVTVPMYDTLGLDAVKHMAVETEMVLIAVAPEKLTTFMALWPDLPRVKTAVILGDIPKDLDLAAAPEGTQVLTLDVVAEMGSKDGLASLPEQPATPHDPCTICYTSGTTGKPKGVVLSHMCFISTTNAAEERMSHGFIPLIGPNDTHLSILPQAHCFERCLQAVLTYLGARIGFNQGDIRKILDDMYELKPSVLGGVPRIFNRIYDQVWAKCKAKGGLAHMLFNYAYNAKLANLQYNINQHWLWDRLVFKSVRETFGGNLRIIISGSAPISADVLDFMRVVFSTTVVEGYGLTETNGPCGISLMGDMQAGNVGCTLGNCLYKLVSVPGMGYSVDDKPFPRGEICAKGNNVFKEYYKQPELTAQAKDKDGWFATGDIGQFDDRGNLVIIDRKKNMFKLSQGEYVTPERIEVIYTNHALIDQMYVHGDSLQSVLVAVVVPNEEFLRKLPADTPELATLEFEKLGMMELCAKKEVIAHFEKLVNEWGRKNDLKGFEIPKKVYLESDPFSVENNILTPTLKVKRPEAKSRYKEVISRLYEETK